MSGLKSLQRKSGPARLRERLEAGQNILSMGAVDPVSAGIVAAAGFDMAALQSFQYSASWGVPDVGVRMVSDVLRATQRITSTVDIPLLVDMEGGFGSPAHAAYWTREFERAGAAAVHIDDEGDVHMCPWLPGSDESTQVGGAEATAEIIRAMVQARRRGLVIAARCQVKSDRSTDWQGEELRRLLLYIEAGADVVFVPKSLSLLNDLEGTRQAAERFPVPLIIQQNPPGFIRKEIPKNSLDGRSLADWTFSDLFDAGIRIVNAWSVFAVPYEATRRRLAGLMASLMGGPSTAGSAAAEPDGSA
jgi:2-methylisocitrate lyase-like PEP mutase family enzyme